VPSLVPGTHLVNHHGDTEVAEVVERTAAFVLSVPPWFYCASRAGRRGWPGQARPRSAL